MALFGAKETAAVVKIKDIIMNFPGTPSLITWALRSRVLSLAGRRRNATGEEVWEIGSLRLTGQTVASLKRVWPTWQGAQVALSSWEHLLADCQQGKRDLSPTGRSWILPITWMSLEIDSSPELYLIIPRKSLGQLTPWFRFCEIRRRETSWPCLDFRPKRTEIINICCFKPLTSL